MKMFQLICGILLVLSIGVGAWLLNDNSRELNVILVTDPKYPVASKYAVDQLQTLNEEFEQLNFKEIEISFSNESFANEVVQLSKQSNVVFTGCFSEACKLELLTILREYPTPFIFTGRSSGLATASYLWNFGPTFNQIIQPALYVMGKYGYDNPILIKDDSVSSHLVSKLIEDLLISRGWNLKFTINIQYDKSLNAIKNLESSIEREFLINTSCFGNSERLLSSISDFSHVVFSTCSDLEMKKAKAIHWTSGVINNKSSIKNEHEYLTDLSIYFFKLVLSKEAFDLKILSNMEFAVNGQTVVMDVDTQHMWHYSNIYSLQETDSKLLYKTDSIVKPVVYPKLRQPSEWDLFLELFWRNHNGMWRF